MRRFVHESNGSRQPDDVVASTSTATQTIAVYGDSLPLPEGWFFIATRKEIEKDRLLEKKWLDDDIVLWCNEEGEIAVAHSFCAHMGSKLGPSVGGQLCNGNIVCPFHGFAYDVSGQCVATPNAPSPVNARLRMIETYEWEGMVFGWWSGVGRPAQWRIPDFQYPTDGWTSLQFQSFFLNGHPQDTAENSVDVNHFRYIHGYDDVYLTEEPVVDGALLRTAFRFCRKTRLFGVSSQFEVSATVHVCGLGCSYVEIREETIGIDARFWVLTTPIDQKTINVILCNQIASLADPKRFFVGLGFLPTGLRSWAMNCLLSRWQKNDVEDDVVIWGTKAYQPKPVLSRTDGAIMMYRRYCEQFYPQETHNAENR